MVSRPPKNAMRTRVGADKNRFIYLGNSFNYASLPLSINILIKVLINQILYTPIFNTYFFGMQSLLSFHHSVFSLEAYYAAWEHVKRTVPTSFVNSCKLWPGVTAFNFWVVPQDFRSIFAGVIAIGWQTYLSFLNRKAEKEEAVEQARLALLEGAAKSEVLKATAPVEAVPAKAQMNARLATDASNSDRNRKA